MHRRLPDVAGLAFAAGLPLVVAIALHGGWALDAEGRHPLTAFGASHVWGLDHIAAMLTGEQPLVLQTDGIGFPRGGPAPTLGWGPALVSLPVRLLLGPLWAYAFAVLSAPALAGAAAYGWLRAVLRATPVGAACGAVLFGACPAVLNNLALGNVDKLTVWVYPAWLLLAGLAVMGRRPVPVLLATVGAAAVALIAPMSEPYLGLFLPLVGVPLVGLSVLDRPAGQRLWAALRSIVVLVVTALAMLPARSYFAVYTTTTGGDRLFRPAAVQVATGGDGWTRPWANLADLVTTPVAIPDDPMQAFHVFYVGMVGLVAGVVLAVLPGARRRRYGFVLAGVALCIVLGPYTVFAPEWNIPGPQSYALPVTLLERLGYPTAVGGQYYRALPLVSLGAGALLAVGLSARRTAVAAALGLGVVVGAIVDAVAVTPDAWPRPLMQVPCRAELQAIRSAEGPGAVMYVHTRADQGSNGQAMMLATLHGRPVNTLPLHTPADGIDPAYAALRPVGEYDDTESAVAWLQAQGFRFLMVTPLGDVAFEPLSRERLQATLGPQTWGDDACATWDLGPPPVSAGPGPGAGPVNPPVGGPGAPPPGPR